MAEPQVPGVNLMYMAVSFLQSILLIASGFIDRLITGCEGTTLSKSTLLTRHVVDVLIKGVFLITPIAGIVASKGNALALVGTGAALAVYLVLFIFSAMDLINLLVNY